MNRMRLAGSMLLLVMTFSMGEVGAAEWQMLADDSRLEVFVRYSGQEAPGLFRRFTTELQFDPVAPAEGQLIVKVAILSADLDSADINEAVAGPEWFDFSRYADAQFVSDSITRIDDGEFVATGRLRLKGIEKIIDVPFMWSEADGLAHMRGELMLQRGDFEIGTGEWAAADIIGENVRVRFNVKFRTGAE